jgi:hypothetical protein
MTTRTTGEHYVYLYQQGSKTLEVVFTGRVAKKKTRRGETILHEIKAADEDMDFREWVKRDQLFTIEDED